ncbi:hypothetical protein HPP92_019663 [Vanilla planifolia]|uniref:Uncharacterized protein n=1 Tax=Vanilla planifolia TaxID=51239 RepID=A0A835Q4H3_VANPL|nr:hypothetical protein HPP92_019663 [Vanilla planifolia]
MASTSSRNRCHGGGLHGSGDFTRSLSPTGRFFSGAGNMGRFSSPTGVNSAFASSSATAFSVSPASTFASRCCDFPPPIRLSDPHQPRRVPALPLARPIRRQESTDLPRRSASEDLHVLAD